MLGKLLKYEIKATARIFFPLYLSLLVFAAMNRILSSFDSGLWNTPSFVASGIYTVIMVGMFVMTFITMIQRFYKNLLSDEGYLMFTLPTKSWTHVVSKLLVSLLWIIVSSFFALLSIFIIGSDQDTISQLSQGFTIFITQINAQLGVSGYVMLFEVSLLGILSLASGILLIYASIALGHLFSHKKLAAFGAFIILNTLTQIFVMLISKIGVFPLDIQISPNNPIYFQYLLGFLITLLGVIFAAYFTITNIILSRHLNLE